MSTPFTAEAPPVPEALLHDTVDATWPPLRVTAQGPWAIREGGGGGKRVSAASPTGPITPGDITRAEVSMARLEQPLLFRLTRKDDALDSMLAERDYRIVDPVNFYVASCDALTRLDTPEPHRSIAIWEPLAIQREIWAEGGIGPARVAVMERATGPRTALLARNGNEVAGTAYIALHGKIAMLHALEILSTQRRQGLGRSMMIDAARWAKSQGARFLSVLCVERNTAANGLYRTLGMAHAGHYHYRLKD